VKMLFKFGSVYDPDLQYADHAQPVDYEISLPPAPRAAVERGALYVHQAAGRRRREIDAATEHFVDETRTGATD
jgi:hopanoid C-3 methylase